MAGTALLTVLVAWGVVANWFVHHPRPWLDARCASWPRFVTAPLLGLGNPLADATDALGWTGHDAVYEYDTEAPAGSIAFAGLPVRVGAPAPADIITLTRGEFTIGWSPSLRHPVWCAYHVPVEARYPVVNRPPFSRDTQAAASPAAGVYANTGYDRGHMVPNFAIASRFGPDAQRQTFKMSNVAPQMPALNRGVWRDLEHRIAELWPARWGEIWVIVGAVSATTSRETLSGSDVDVPCQYYQVVVAQSGMDVRAFAVLFPQEISWSAYPTRYLITIDELEKITGLDFLPDLPQFIQSPLEAELPTRVWPIRARDLFRQIAIRFH